MIGLQASGKSTFVQERFGDAYTVVSKDLMRNSRRPEHRQRELIRDALARGESVVVDNTNPRLEDRLPLIGIARGQGARVVGYFFEPAVRTSVARNRAREGPARVPDVAIFATAKKMKRPSPEEGFDQLFLVRSLPGERFEITPWSDSDG